MTINITFSDKTVRVAVELNGAIESAITELPQRKPLTDEQIDAIYTGVRAVHHEIDSYVFARAIEAAHGIKENT